MSEPFMAEIKITSFNFAPRGWALCDGQLVQINQNQALFALLGTTYGGNGQTNFALPDLRGRVPIHRRDYYSLGERSGEQYHTVTIGELPTHIHVLNGTSAPGDTPNPGNNLFAVVPAKAYGASTNLTSLQSSSVVNNGGSQAHDNMQPYLVLSFCIAMQGIFPSQN